MFNYNHLTPSWSMRSELDCVLYWHQSAELSWPITGEYCELSANQSPVSSQQPIRGELRKLSANQSPATGDSLAISWLHATSPGRVQLFSFLLTPGSSSVGLLYCTVLYCTVLYCTVTWCTSILHNTHTQSSCSWVYMMYMDIIRERNLLRFFFYLLFLQIQSLQI